MQIVSRRVGRDPESLQMMADERLREPDVRDELRDARFAIGKPTHDP